jgi:mutator family transposase
VHLIRAALRCVYYRDLKKVASALRPIYNAPNADHAMVELKRFDAEWGARYPATVRAWRDPSEHVISFLSLPEQLRRAVYTTDAALEWTASSGHLMACAVRPRKDGVCCAENPTRVPGAVPSRGGRAATWRSFAA